MKNLPVHINEFVIAAQELMKCLRPECYHLVME